MSGDLESEAATWSDMRDFEMRCGFVEFLGIPSFESSDRTEGVGTAQGGRLQQEHWSPSPPPLQRRSNEPLK